MFFHQVELLPKPLLLLFPGGGGGRDRVFPIAWHTACDTGDVPAHQLGDFHHALEVAGERRMSESILGYPQWEPEMGISATPALPAILAFGWEEHHKSIARCQP